MIDQVYRNSSTESNVVFLLESDHGKLNWKYVEETVISSLRYYLSISLDGLKKIMKNLSQNS